MTPRKIGIEADAISEPFACKTHHVKSLIRQSRFAYQMFIAKRSA